MQVRNEWTKPELVVYGSVEEITEQININKNLGTKDNINLNDVTIAQGDGGRGTVTGPGGQRFTFS